MKPEEITIYTTFTPYQNGSGLITRMSTHAMERAPENCSLMYEEFPARVIYLQPKWLARGLKGYWSWAKSCLGRDCYGLRMFRGLGNGVDAAMAWLVEKYITEE